MRDHPMLFSAPMVRAELDETKTQTRRKLRFQPAPGISIIRKTIRPIEAEPYHAFERRSLYGNYAGELDIKIKRGDRIWVREHWCTEAHYDDLAPSDMGGEEPVKFKADVKIMTHGFPAMQRDGRHRQAMHMPRWASRLTLIVTDVRVERLQDISEADAKAEGVEQDSDGWRDYLMPETQCCATARDSYRTLWDSINGPGAWDANPWVVAYSFAVRISNIDQIARAA